MWLIVKLEATRHQAKPDKKRSSDLSRDVRKRVNELGRDKGEPWRVFAAGGNQVHAERFGPGIVL